MVPMVYYHGTTLEKAEMIVQRGFLPKSGLVWFSRVKWFVQTHARHTAYGGHDQAIVFACDLDVRKLRAQLGEHRVTTRGHVLTVGGFVQPSVLRAYATLHLLDSHDKDRRAIHLLLEFLTKSTGKQALRLAVKVLQTRATKLKERESIRALIRVVQGDNYALAQSAANSLGKIGQDALPEIEGALAEMEPDSKAAKLLNNAAAIGR